METTLSLSELVALAHAKRATERASKYAKRYGVLVYVYRAKHGWVMDTARPTMGDWKRVSPSGTITEGKTLTNVER